MDVIISSIRHKFCYKIYIYCQRSSQGKKIERRYFTLIMKILLLLFFSFCSKEKDIQKIIHHWIRTLNIQLGWIKNFDKFVVDYVSSFVLSFLKCQLKYSNII
ncbi:hypothetical protein RFI_29307 [Reticulomyxa filosa]|uniref:Uncharacterized protein n=1 Tax=Reticulomyxa filosa TaxID=46433 RepID=X6M3N5_RETFI|nr:hypothetical protein RFI_29307 [Reticulomyxa filosa]|eukprot:ETO08082.1 hypothetical protein RFI_29307 [Reticulomyxa filosa]